MDVEPRVLGRLLFAERFPVPEHQRAAAAARLDRAVAAGQLSGDQRQAGAERLAEGRTRADLRAALEALPGAMAPLALPATVCAATVLWAVSGLVSLLVWTAGGLLTLHWESPWWVWVIAGLAPVVAGLWWTLEWDYRLRLRDWAGGRDEH